MMQQYKTEIKWGFIFIGVSLVWMFLEKLTGFHDRHIDKHPFVTMLFIIPAVVVYVMALKEKKTKDYGGQMTFKQGFVSGMIIALVVMLLTPASQWIISSVISPSFFENAISRSVELGYYKTVAAAEANFNLKNYIIQGCVGAIAAGAITSVVVAFFLRSKK